MARKYPQEVREFIIENVRGHTSRELADMVNAEFGLDVTPQKIASTKKNWGLVSGTPCGLPAGAGSKVFPREIVDYILANHKGTGYQEMADRLREKFGREYTREQIKGFYHNHHLDSGIKGYFQKGHTPQNKGKTWDEYMTPEAQARARAGQFQKGHTPHNGAVPVGTVRIRHDPKDRNAKPYAWEKVAQPNVWRMKHVVEWERHHGPVPKGYMVAFANGDTMDWSVDNLILETKAQHAVKNRWGLHGYDKESAQAFNTIADIKGALRKKKAGRRKNADVAN